MNLRLENHYDAAHGWLKVPRSIIPELRFPISSYSYMDDEYVYLEEDLDAQQFLDAADKANCTINIIDIHDGLSSPIRNLPRYR